MTDDKTYIRDGRAPIPKNEVISRVMSSIKGKNTFPELMFRKVLWHNEIKGYRIHWKKAPGRPDVAFPSIKLAIFINGCYWHRCPYCNPPIPKTHTQFWTDKFNKNINRDEKKIAELENAGWVTLTVWECQIPANIDTYIKTIKTYLTSRRNNNIH